MLKFFSDKPLVNIYTLPFLVFPFNFIMRNWDPNNYFIIALPDLLIFFPIIYFFFKNKFHFNYEITLISISLFLMIFFSLINLAIQNQLNLISLILLFREIILPILFLIIFFNLINNSNSIALNAIKLSISSIAIVSFISLLNYFEFISFNESYSTLNPAHTFHISAITRDVFNFGFEIPRLNPLMGGAIGSIAAILVSTSFFILGENFFKNFIKISISLILFITSFFTQSYSGIFILILALIFFTNFYIKIFLIFLFCIIISFYKFSLINEFIYYLKIILLSLFDAINKFSFSEILFGLGPRFYNNYIEIIHPKLITDSGIFRIFFEFGIIVFILKILFLLNLIFKLINDKFDRKYLYLFLLISFLIIIHGNIFLLKPLNLYFYSLLGYIYYNIKIN